MFPVTEFCAGKAYIVGRLGDVRESSGGRHVDGRRSLTVERWRKEWYCGEMKQKKKKSCDDVGTRG